MDFTLSKTITFDNGTIMSACFNVRNAFNAIPPGEDLMGRCCIIGVRANL